MQSWDPSKILTVLNSHTNTADKKTKIFIYTHRSRFSYQKHYFYKIHHLTSMCMIFFKIYNANWWSYIGLKQTCKKNDFFRFVLNFFVKISSKVDQIQTLTYHFILKKDVLLKKCCFSFKKKLICSKILQ